MTETELAYDVIRGAAKIAEYLNITERRVYYCAEKKLLPISKEGNTLISTKSALRKHYGRVAAGEAA